MYQEENDILYDNEEEIFDSEGMEHRRQAEEEERMQRRIRREIIRVGSGELDEEIKQERQRMAEEEDQRREAELREQRRGRSLWRLLTTGSFLTSSGATFYYRLLIAIAVMCFVSIFLSFMSLNAERECRQLEEHAKILRERSIIIEERRHGVASKSEVERMLKERGIDMIDLSNDSRLIEK